MIRLRIAQSDLGLRCPHIPEDTFLHGAAHLESTVLLFNISDPAQMSHQEIMDTLSKPVYPNLARDIMLEKLYTFLIGVIAIVLCLVWVMLFPSNRR